jgi:SAM-dependent MidA family methyltransferase
LESNSSINSAKEQIIRRIASEGPLSFEVFMEMALYFPKLGYYTKETTTIGRKGDFYTSPHLHPLFGAMIGKQMEEMWQLLDRPLEFRVVEMGAGSGYLAKDMLEYLEGREIYESLDYSIVELNPSVKVRQSALLNDFRSKVRWFDRLIDVGQVTGCFLSNELLDAFPVRLVEMNDGLQEIYVSIRGNNEFVEIERNCSREVEEYFGEFSVDVASVMQKGYRTEVNLRIKDWLREISASLERGFVLTVDYGYPADDYYSSERGRGTFLCYHRHQVNEDPYINIGEQDMTAHVNFSSVKKWGEDVGLRTVGFVPQGTYLISLGMDEVMADMPGLAGDAFDNAKIKGLLLPEGMGESHKVLVQYKGQKDIRLRGFELRNRMKYL